ncbi:MAG: two-component sensor histidine kinase [Peptococcaceae bacterium]|nr:two-component sensor histidine kinase [Peptococcaceae bacterium]
MPGLFRQGFRVQMIIVVSLLLLIPVIVLFYDIFFLEKSEDVLLTNLEKKLSGITDNLASQICNKMEAGGRDRDLNQVMKQAFDEVAVPMSQSYNGVRLCMYVVETDKIYIHGFIHEYKKRPPEEQAAREARIRNEAAAGISAVVSGGVPITRVGKTWDDNFLECLAPIFVDSKIAAVVWAEERIHPAFARSRQARIVIMYIILVLIIAGLVGTQVATNQVNARVDQILRGLREIEKDFSKSIPPMPGDLGQIAAAINKMARGLAEKKQLEEQLKRSEGLATLGRLAADIAHEIRNPMCIIQATAELIAEEVRKNKIPNMDDHFNMITSQIDRHNKLTAELLDFGRSEGYRVESLDLNGIVKEVVQYIAPLAQKSGIRVNFEQEDGIKAFQGNREKLHQVFINIIMNAIQAMPGGGQLDIKTFQPREDKICVTIRDYGVGIERENIPQIFEPFYTGKKEGTGLGLAISQEIIKIHRGSIEIESEPGKGTTFIICFPV